MHAHQEQDREQAPGRTGRAVRGASADAPAHAPTAATPLTPGQVQALQRTAGNAAVVQRVAQESHTHDANCGHGRPVQRSAVHDVLRTSGQPFTGPQADRVSAHYGGADLSHLRVHTDSLAQASAAEIGARAYTSGHHIVLGADHSEEDVRHEVFHTFQQAAGPVSGKDNGDGLRISEDSSREEQDARAAARTPSAAPPVQRVADDRADAARQRPGTTPVQRMFSGFGRKAKAAAPAGPPQVDLRVGDETIQTIHERGFYRFVTQEGGTGFIHELAVHNGTVDADLVPYITRYRNGALTLYRGIPRWHPTWQRVTGQGEIPPLGQGFYPSFDTRQTSFIPFAPTEVVARSAAISARGMGDGDEAQYVQGYSRQIEHPVGALVSVLVRSNQDVGFFNATEIQARGPLDLTRMQIMGMSTDVDEALTGQEGNPRDELRNHQPPTPTDDEKSAYINRFGSLRD
ncbi:eCIS core domain-containing protein [Streptomyces herbicida]|uniref:eCIS core domain-containing protein n=1 Tax=Streptomyces herbicida TaxID=3065675 RepID=UPI00293097A8|nr:DUF4157 domain-containing protein [Streptomyces sp. NEAU-HV9]